MPPTEKEPSEAEDVRQARKKLLEATVFVDRKVSAKAKQGAETSPGGLRWYWYLVFIVAGIAIMYFLIAKKDADAWKFAEDHLKAQYTDPKERELALLLGRQYHREALSEATPKNLRGKKENTSVDTSAYYQILSNRIQSCLNEFKSAEQPSAARLVDYWLCMVPENETNFVVSLHSDGTFRGLHFNISDSSYGTPLDTVISDKWRFENGKIIWGTGAKEDVNPVEKYGGVSFVLREKDGHLTYWRRISPPQNLKQQLQ